MKLKFPKVLAAAIMSAFLFTGCGNNASSGVATSKPDGSDTMMRVIYHTDIGKVYRYVDCEAGTVLYVRASEKAGYGITSQPLNVRLLKSDCGM